MLYTSLYIFLCKRGTSRDMGRDAGRETGRVKGDVGGGGGGEAVERGDLGRKVGLGEQCLSFDILLPLPHLLCPSARVSTRVSACVSISLLLSLLLSLL